MTPLQNIEGIYFKREDLNLTGSAKDRAIKHQVANLVAQHYQSAVISSTGNAAISAQYFCQQNHLPLTIFLPPQTTPGKKEKLDNFTISSRPISAAIKFAKSNHAYLLRQSTDPVALTGYAEISQEIISDLPTVTSVFFPVGSGTTLLGVSQNLPSSVKIFAVQSAYNCPLSRYFQMDYQPETINPTPALTAKYLPLKSQIIHTLQQHQGKGLIVPSSAITSAKDWLTHHQINCSPEGALALAGYWQIKELAGDFPVIIITGTSR